MGDNRLIQDVFVCDQQLALVEKYEDFLNFMYPITENIPRRYSIMRDKFVSAMFEQVRLFIEAGKSSHKSKLHAADANLAHLRFYLRFMVMSPRELISKSQHKTASVHLAQTGKMLGAWIRDHGGQKG